MTREFFRCTALVLGLSLFMSANATTITIVSGDGPGEGFNSSTPAAPVAGNPGTTLGQQYANVFRAAADFWESKIDSSVEIRVQAVFDPLVCEATQAQLGGAGPLNGFINFPNAPAANTIYVVAHANSIAGEDLDPINNDIDSVFNSLLNGNPSCLGGVSWWTGINSPAPSGTIALYDTVLHEIAHGLGFLTLVDSNGQRLQDFNDVFMLNLFDVSQGRSWAAMTNTQRRTSTVSNGSVVWRGSNVAAGAGVFTAGRNAGMLRIYAPNPYEQGSSNSHWDTVLGPDELMEPFATTRSDSCATVLAFKDMGWRTRDECGASGANPNGDFIVPPILQLLLLDDDSN